MAAGRQGPAEGREILPPARIHGAVGSHHGTLLLGERGADASDTEKLIGIHIQHGKHAAQILRIGTGKAALPVAHGADGDLQGAGQVFCRHAGGLAVFFDFEAVALQVSLLGIRHGCLPAAAAGTPRKNIL